ncbi:uncharacterized protein LOC124453545 isoform X2 [Xenia sp. Carnegie-2017]|uniref:uncharacterized protein LOC124453545 isoform X2 n=1 Tax=Xenia sp. Carnegie-2017 TaxID=2897299 RepID=UPI001F03D459|nr:uncharacterized protein LOC124453545 isoform X2 [Xenia sp. Carnegie-2017]XP_046860288.1 uncharacterized protein LOC124453545 isoform X2 [Xenia sp. Carnegie-2017]
MDVNGNKTQQPNESANSKSNGAIEVKLLVLHQLVKKPKVYKVCDAMDTYPPPQSVMVDPDVRIEKIPASGEFDKTTTQELGRSIDSWTRQGHVVTIMFLANFDFAKFEKSTGIKLNKIVLFCFKTPHVDQPSCTLVDVNFEKAKMREIRSAMGDLIAAVRSKGMN